MIDTDRLEAITTAARLLAQSAQAMELGARYHKAAIGMLTELCAGTTPDAGSEGLRRIVAFRSACHERGIRMTADDHIAEKDAAELLTVARSTLATWRQEGRLQCRRTPTGAVQYSLAELAQFVGGFEID